MTSAGDQTVLPYAGPGAPAVRPRPELYRAALIFGSAPLCIGTCAFCIWAICRPGYYLPIAVVGVVAGLTSIGFGGVALVAYFWKEVRVETVSDWVLYRRVALALAIFGLNFPAAAIMVAAADHMQNRIVVTVKHVGTSPITRLTVKGAGGRIDFGSVQPSATLSRSLYVGQGGTVTFSCIQSGQVISGTAASSLDSDDVPGNAGIRLTVRDGAIDAR